MLLLYWIFLFLLVYLLGTRLSFSSPDRPSVANLRRLVGRVEEPSPTRTVRKPKRLGGLERSLGAAGSGLRGREFLALILLAVFFLMPLGYRWGGLPGLLAGALLGGYLPYWNLGRLRRNRQSRLEKDLPETLGSLANGLRAGYSFFQSLEMAGRQLSGPLAQEISRVVTDLRVGRSPEEALGSWAERSGSSDIDLLVTSLLIQRQVGGNLAALLDRLQATIRERQRRRGEVRALTAQGRLSGWIVATLPLALLAVMSLMDPRLIRPLFTTGAGHLILLLAGFLELLGILSIRKLLQVEV